MRPVIGILSNYCKDTQEDYVKAVEKAGGCPVIISKVNDVKTLEPLINMLDGILFTGGSDINPLMYKAMPEDVLWAVDPARDAFEMTLAKYILRSTTMPILGICRGMQMLNVVEGGSLYQDLIKQKATEVNHWTKEIFPRDEPSHPAKIQEASKIYSIFKKDSIMVNSIHHQGIRKLATAFNVTMISEDGVIEAIEMKGERFIVGVQWHPEMLINKNPEYLSLFESFVHQRQQQRA